MLKPRMSVSVSMMIIILSLHRNWCSGRTKHLLVNVLDSQDKFPSLNENGSEERGQDYQDDDYYSNEFQPAPPAYSGSVESLEPLAASNCESCEIFQPDYDSSCDCENTGYIGNNCQVLADICGEEER